MIRIRAWIEVVLAALAVTVGIITAVFPTWFEALFESSPDSGSGALERTVAIALLLASALLSLLARRDFRQSRVPRPDTASD